MDPLLKVAKLLQRPNLQKSFKLHRHRSLLKIAVARKIQKNYSEVQLLLKFRKNLLK